MENQKKQMYELATQAVKNLYAERGVLCAPPSDVITCVIDALLENGAIIPPCKKGDIVYWVDALNQVTPVKVANFVISICDVKGSTYMGNFQNGGLHVTEEAAAKQVVENRKRSCEQCFKDTVTGNYKLRCETDKCSKHHFKEHYAEQWREEAIAEMIKEDEAVCKRCYISHIKNDREQNLQNDCERCSGKLIKERCAPVWDKELE